MSRISRMSRDEFERQAVLYAMGALSSEEARRFEVERARRGAEGESLDEGLRQAIGPRKVTPVERMALAAVTAEPRRRALWPWVLLSLVCLAAGAAAAYWGWTQRSGAAADAGRIAGLETSVDSLTGELERGRLELQGRPRPEELAPLLVDNEMAFTQLSGATGARGRIISVPGGPALLVATGVDPLPEGQTYRLWRRFAGVPQPVADVGDARRGFLFTYVSESDFLNNAEALQVTAESSDSQVPAGPVVLEGRP